MIVQHYIARTSCFQCHMLTYGLVINWLDWARKKADWYDPFMEADDDIFQDLDRDSF